MRVGDYVETHKFGWGTVVGFEVLDNHRSWLESAPNPRDPTQRVLLALDHPERWILATPGQPHPYMMARDFVGYVDPYQPAPVASTVAPMHKDTLPMPTLPLTLRAVEDTAEDVWDQIAQCAGYTIGGLMAFVFLFLLLAYVYNGLQ